MNHTIRRPTVRHRHHRWSMLLLLAAAPVAAQTRQATNLVTHSEVTIDRPATAVWPHIVDPSPWKRGAKLWHHAGPVGQIGEIFAAGDPANKSNVFFLLENVELVPNQRRTIKLVNPAGTLLGYATWWLAEKGGRTTVGYDVYSESLLDPAQAMSADQIRAAEQSDRLTNQKRFDEELRGLKRLVEQGGAVPPPAE